MPDPDDTSVEQRVRRRAYILWERAGRPEGRSDEFWEKACDDVERELMEEQEQAIHQGGQRPRRGGF